MELMKGEVIVPAQPIDVYRLVKSDDDKDRSPAPQDDTVSSSLSLLMDAIVASDESITLESSLMHLSSLAEVSLVSMIIRVDRSR